MKVNLHSRIYDLSQLDSSGGLCQLISQAGYFSFHEVIVEDIGPSGRETSI